MYGDPQQHSRDVLLSPAILSRLTLDALRESNREMWGAKIGDNLNVRLPPRFSKPPVSITDDVSLDELAKLLGR